MGRATFTHMDAANTVANYVSTGRAMSDAIKLTGLTQTADTGQVVWANVTALPAANTVRDFEVYRFADALQATKPIFIRIDYLNNSMVDLAVSVGTGTDGAGNLTGVIAPRVRVGTAQAASTFAHTGWASTGDGSQFSFGCGMNPAATTPSLYTQWFAIDRSRDAAGAPTGAGYAVWYGTGFRFWKSVMRITDGVTTAQPAEDFNLLQTVPNLAAASAFVGDTSYAFPVYSATPEMNGGGNGLLVAYIGDFPRGSEVTIPYQGTAKTWVSLSGMVEVTVGNKTSEAAVAAKTMTMLLRY